MKSTTHKPTVPLFLLILVMTVFSACTSSSDKTGGNEYQFSAIVLGINGGSVTVEIIAADTIEGESLLCAGAKLDFSCSNLDKIDVSVDDVISILIKGEIMETDPAQANVVSWSIREKTSQDAAQTGIIPSEWFDDLNGKDMTLDDVRDLAAKGYGLTLDDFLIYKGINGSADSLYDRYSMIFSVQGGYELVVRVNPDADGMMDVVGFARKCIVDGLDLRIAGLEGLETYIQEYALPFAVDLLQETYTTVDGTVVSDSTMLLATFVKGETISKIYDGWWSQNSYVLQADLTGSGSDELILVLGYGGSNYGASDIHVFDTADDTLTEILTILDSPEDEDAITYQDSLYTIPVLIDDVGNTSPPNMIVEHYIFGITGAGSIEDEDGAGLTVMHLMVNYEVPYSTIRWNGTDWYVSEQGMRELP